MRKVDAAPENVSESGRWATPLAYERARMLRRNVTAAEECLWQALRAKRLHGFKFRRQHPMGRFVADFYCAEACLVIELDGGIHNTAEQQERDKSREEILITLRNVTLLRFNNDEVLNNLQATTNTVLAYLFAHQTTQQEPISGS